MKAWIIALAITLTIGVVSCNDKNEAPKSTASQEKTVVAPASKPEMNQEQQVGYGVGVRLSEKMIDQFGPVDPEWLEQGYRAVALANGTDQSSLLNHRAMLDVLNAQQTKIFEERRKLNDEIAKQAKELQERYENQVKTFLGDFRARDDVKLLDSGVMYRVIEEGQGKQQPAAYDQVVVDYEARLANGTVFDSSFSRNQTATLLVQGVIPGMVEVLQNMRKGDHWEVVIPGELAYGSRGMGPIPPNAPLVFDLVLHEIIPPGAENATARIINTGS